jgi:hypothetical protein
MNPKISGILAATALLASGCAMGNHHKAPGAQTTQARYQQAVTWAKCIRTHGAPSWPDPGPGGAFPNDNGSLDKIRSTTGYKTADAACKNVAPGGGPPDQAALKQEYEKLLKFSACMRSHGLPSFPDPKLDKGGVGIEGDLHPDSPQFKTATQACKSLAPRGF